MNFKQQVTAILEECLTEWESNPQRMESGYNYEFTYASMAQKVERNILQLSVGKVSRDKNIKKTSKTFNVYFWFKKTKKKGMANFYLCSSQCGRHPFRHQCKTFDH